MTSKATNLTDKQLIQAIFDALEDSDTRYGFFLGAGASVASGIPAAKELSEKWLEIIDESTSVDTSKWEKDPAKSYSEVFSQRFIANPIDGEDELRKYIDNAKPSIGYLLLAQILIKTKNNFVLTTNFDTMTEDALFSLKNAKPLIIGHKSLANYIPVNNFIRPTIMKLHHDYLLGPKNTKKTTKKLPESFKKKLNSILENTHLIFIGYGGNDASIMSYLKKNTNRKPIYWCCLNKEALPAKVEKMLTHQDFIVEIKGFDRFILVLNGKLKLESLIDRNDIKKSLMVIDAIEAAEGYRKQLEKLVEIKLEDEEIEAIKGQLPTWWDYEFKVRGELDADKKNEIYKEGLKAHPKSPELHVHYALFLQSLCNDYNKAEIHYKRALEFDPNNINANGNYAIFLSNIRHDNDKAEIHYKHALKFDPNHVDVNYNYAIFLSNIRYDHDKAEIHYKHALKFDPTHVNANDSYAVFLSDIRHDYDKAEIYYKRALKFDPNHVSANGNYAVFLGNIRHDYDKAEIHYKRSLEFDPNNINVNSNYAAFLHNIHPDYDKAEIHYKRVLKFDPNNININGSYAAFLHIVRSDYDKAEIHYKCALEFDPNHVILNANYAQFLLIQGKNSQAEAYLNKAFKFSNNYKDLLTVLWFYRLAHYPAYRAEAIERLDELLEAGARLTGWGFSENIKQAEKQGFKPIELLQKYADKISEAKDV